MRPRLMPLKKTWASSRPLAAWSVRRRTPSEPSASVVQGVSEDMYGIGYSGIGYKTSGVKSLALAAKDGAPFVSTDPANVYAGKYPLARFLYVYVNQPPNKPADPLVKQFLAFVLSQEGQTIVVKDGYLPLTAKMVEQEKGVLH